MQATMVHSQDAGGLHWEPGCAAAMLPRQGFV